MSVGPDVNSPEKGSVECVYCISELFPTLT